MKKNRRANTTITMIKGLMGLKVCVFCGRQAYLPENIHPAMCEKHTEMVILRMVCVRRGWPVNIGNVREVWGEFHATLQAIREHELERLWDQMESYYGLGYRADIGAGVVRVVG